MLYEFDFKCWNTPSEKTGLWQFTNSFCQCLKRHSIKHRTIRFQWKVYVWSLFKLMSFLISFDSVHYFLVEREQQPTSVHPTWRLMPLHLISTSVTVHAKPSTCRDVKHFGHVYYQSQNVFITKFRKDNIN